MTGFGFRVSMGRDFKESPTAIEETRLTSDRRYAIPSTDHQLFPNLKSQTTPKINNTTTEITNQPPPATRLFLQPMNHPYG